MRLVRKAASCRTPRIERGISPIRSVPEKAGTLCPKVPPLPGVEVCPRTTRPDDSDRTRIGPQSAERPKSVARTSAQVRVSPGRERHGRLGPARARRPSARGTSPSPSRSPVPAFADREVGRPEGPGPLRPRARREEPACTSPSGSSRRGRASPRGRGRRRRARRRRSRRGGAGGTGRRPGRSCRSRESRSSTRPPRGTPSSACCRGTACTGRRSGPSASGTRRRSRSRPAAPSRRSGAAARATYAASDIVQSRWSSGMWPVTTTTGSVRHEEPRQRRRISSFSCSRYSSSLSFPKSFPEREAKARS